MEGENRKEAAKKTKLREGAAAGRGKASRAPEQTGTRLFRRWELCQRNRSWCKRQTGGPNTTMLTSDFVDSTEKKYILKMLLKVIILADASREQGKAL